ncbi:toxin-antitoxin system antitoxin subunit [Bifidobacterium avesanii]|uniref:Toxin-antitoxin system antitoxin subunit n=1 Tax=Bifidobacterium avesanii TaxID=1798157 RepID=A0A7K3TK07_9BIFI|nr:toxin-antitoxin system antitoxin subunit [Bifidobacterium avesanii]KAB8286679.1 toxin-antitoxin system antitoxin subunit [Bifidobacterium avesanii]NEG79372.1 toxin-antitoxin system antitoxin subunit [Bifidobacterium avesanii]
MGGTWSYKEEITNRGEINELFGVTDEQLDHMSEEYESGNWEGGVGMVGPGRPRIHDEEMETISFRLTKSRMNTIDARAKRNGETRSQ